MRRKAVLAVVIGALVCLGIGILWTGRLDIPSPAPWWFGKKAVVRIEVWEPGKDMATFAMTMPKGTLDAMYAFGAKATIDIDEGRTIELRHIWKRLQRLGPGEKLVLEEDGAKVLMWIEVKGERAGTAREDTTGAGAPL